MNERDLFLSALEIDDPADRKAHLQSACAGDAGLLARVESLLASHEGASVFLQTPVAEQLDAAPAGGAAATIFVGNGSTEDKGSDQEVADALERAEEVSLGYLQPSARSGSLGRLAHYEILEVVGRGAFGTVLRALDDKLQRVVAIKVMAPELAATSPARKRFLREARASAQIRHEHVVSVHDVGEKPIPYLVMEFVPGQTLQQRLDQRGPLDTADVLRLGIQIAAGLAAAHDRDLIHRDIKPGNILLETTIQDKVKITDFGLARAADDASMTQSGMIAGTPMYMAPEQALGLKLDQRADLFSLGSVLYQMVSGRAPFRAPSTLAVLKRVTEDTPRPIQEIIPETPDWLCNIIAKLHAKNPDERFQTAREVGELLQQHLAHLRQPDRVPPPPAVKAPTSQRGRRLPSQFIIDHPALGGVAILMLLVSLAAATYMWTSVWGNSSYAKVTLDTNDPHAQVYLTSETGWNYRLQTSDDTALPPGTYSLDAYGGSGNDIDLISVDVSAPSGMKDTRAKRDYAKGRNEGKGIELTLAKRARATINVRVAPKEMVPVPGSSAGWVQLFNGKDLTGWKQDGYWTVEDGMLVSRIPASPPTQPGFLTTDRKDFGDFHLRVEAKINAPGDSGLFFRFGEQGDASLQAQIVPSPNHAGSLLRHADVVVPAKLSIKPDTWFTMEVIAQGRKVEIYIDGKKASEWIYPSGSIPSGPIALESGFPKTEFTVRKVELMPLSASSIPEPGWVQLFNGKDLDGWNPSRRDNRDWRVEDGVLVGSNKVADPPYGSCLYTRNEEWRNFHLRAQVRINSAGNGGILFRCKKPAATQVAERPVGYEAVVNVGNQQHPRTGSMICPKSLFEYGTDPLIPANTWCTYEIIARENHFILKVNDQTTLDWHDPNNEVISGPIALQTDERTTVEFRRIEIKELPPEEPGWVQLFNSKDLTGWKTHPEAVESWAVKDGALVGRGDESYLYTERGDYQDFHLRAKVRIGATANSGIHFRSAFSPTMPDGYEAQINVASDKWLTGSLFKLPLGGTDWLLHHVKTSVVRPDELFTFDIVAQGDHLVVKVDGVVVSDVRHSKYDKGHIALQTGRGAASEVRFSTIEIKELPGSSRGPVFTNTLGMEFVLVPKGKSWLGGGKDKPGDKEVEIPEDFYLGKYEVTQEEWEQVMGENPSHFSRTGGSKDKVRDIPDAVLKRFPVENVSWDQCQVFVAKVNQREKDSGWLYRLPKEVEWEYACRGGPMPDRADSAFDFYLAKPSNKLLSYQANIGRKLLRTCKVGTYEPNRLGLHDMHGNVSQWCEDTVDASNGISVRAVRGGGWDYGSERTVAARGAFVAPQFKSWSLGLRLARVRSAAAEVSTPPFTDADFQRIAALPAAQQVEEVRNELIRRNPGFDGKIEHTIEDGVVTELRISTDLVADISPIRVFNALRVLDCSSTHTPQWKANGLLADLTPLNGMDLTGLTHLNLSWTRVNDASLASFKDSKKLLSLILTGTQVTDTGLAHFQGCDDLTELVLDGTQVSDAGLACFKDCKKLTLLYLHVTNVGDAGLAHFQDCTDLKHLWLGGTRLSDDGLAYFKGCKNLTQLTLDNTNLSDVGLAYFKDCKKLTLLRIENSKVTDLSQLQGMPLKELNCDFLPQRDAEILRSIKTLEKINYKPAAEFWDHYDKGTVME